MRRGESRNLLKKFKTFRGMTWPAQTLMSGAYLCLCVKPVGKNWATFEADEACCTEGTGSALDGLQLGHSQLVWFFQSHQKNLTVSYQKCLNIKISFMKSAGNAEKSTKFMQFIVQSHLYLLTIFPTIAERFLQRFSTATKWLSVTNHQSKFESSTVVAHEETSDYAKFHLPFNLVSSVP